MKFISITLCNFKRLALNNISYIKITPENKIQLILGTNGSGKSSLLKEITPLPANHQEFQKDGYKIVEIEHNHSHYVLKSLFPSSGNKFHFIKDSEELNPGGTMTTYRELVKKEFGITPDIHELLIGSVRFHSMSTAERRVWVTRLSEADYTYAIQYFKKLSEQHRDVVGAIKLSQSRLVQETDKLLKPEQEQIYRHEIQLFSQMLSHLLELKTPIYDTKDQVLVQLKNHDSHLQSLSQALIKYRTQFLNHEGFTSEEAIDEALAAAKGRSEALKVLCEQLCEKIQSEQNTLQALKDSNVESVADLDKSIAALQLQLTQTHCQIELKLQVLDPLNASHALSSVYENLHTVASQMELNEDRRYSRDRYQFSIERVKTLQAQLTQLEQKTQTYVLRRKELEHFKQHNEVKCPSCQHTWHQGYSEQLYQDTLSSIAQIGVHTEAINKQFLSENQYLEQARTYLELYRTYSSVTKAWTILNPLWEYISEKDILFKDPKQIINVIDTFKIDLQIMVHLEQMGKKLIETQELKQLLSKNQELSVSSLNEQAEQLNHQLYELNRQQRTQDELIARLTLYRQACVQVNALLREVQVTVTARDDRVTQLLALHKRQAVSEVIELVRLELHQREQMISRIDIQKALVDNIQNQITEMAERAEVLKLAVLELSPSQGLIAKGLTGFINHFVNHINRFIKKIWLYPLELVPIQPDEDDGVDLDYKFAFKVNGDAPISDISKGSTGMKEVIDLAFKIVAMQYLHLNNAPIYLDELAASFDKSHREAAYRMVNDLMVNSNYSQIYIISHFADSYGSFNNSDVITLHDANISKAKDSVFNRTVSMA